MITPGLDDHPQRLSVTKELHARPFQPITAPSRVLHLGFKEPRRAAERDPERDRAHLIDFIDRHGGPHPAPEAKHYFHDFGRFRLKWERHTEFVAYTLYEAGAPDELFAPDLAELFPADWLAEAPGKVIAAVQVEVLTADSPEAAEDMLRGRLGRAFNAESLAVARVLDGQALALGDFRIHEHGFTRFALIVHGTTGPRRIGRLIQRLKEIETYRTMAMLALPISRRITERLNEIERELTELIAHVAEQDSGVLESEILAALTRLSAEIESIAASTAFRFAAGAAYEAIVHQRIESLREERVSGRQLFAEFMARRFNPAMRSCHATDGRLSALATRASRVAELLRTRVNVAVETQNQRLLQSMDRRAALQLRLQETVEGLSVVAISYYAVSLAGFVLAPFSGVLGLSKATLSGIIALPVIALVWWMVRRMRERLAAK